MSDQIQTSTLDLNESEFSKFSVIKGDLFFTRSSLKLEGIAHCNIYDADDKDIVFECHIMRVRPDQEKAVPYYLREYCVSSPARKYFMSYAKTGTMTTIDQAGVGGLPVILPPLPEQKKISKILSTWDKAISQLESLIELKEKRKRGLMQQLLTGKKRFPGFSGEWEEVKLSKVASFINDGTHSTPSYQEQGVPFYSVENISRDDFTNTKFISVEEHEKLIRRCNPEKWDVLMTRIGTLGATKLIDWDVNASIYVSLALIRIDQSRIDLGYFYEFTKSEIFVREVKKRSLLNAAPQKINLKDIGQIKLNVPAEKEEQIRIGRLLASLRREIGNHQESKQKLSEGKKALMQQLLTGKKRVQPDEVDHG